MINGINNNEVWLYKVVNGGHEWPGAWGNMDINAGEEVWNFFSQYLVIADRGDINFDGSINIMDMLLISNNILNNESYNYTDQLGLMFRSASWERFLPDLTYHEPYRIRISGPSFKLE